MSFNKIILCGNLGKDPELRYTPAGDAVCEISMATTERKKDKSGEYQDQTTWFKVTLWRKQAENAAKFLAKGRQVYIEGRLSEEHWTDRDGGNRVTLAVQATEMHFIGSRNDDDGGVPAQAHTHTGPSTQAPAQRGFGAPPPATTDDDIPF